jgi:hypothetical protein
LIRTMISVSTDSGLRPPSVKTRKRRNRAPSEDKAAKASLDRSNAFQGKVWSAFVAACGLFGTRCAGLRYRPLSELQDGGSKKLAA